MIYFAILIMLGCGYYTFTYGIDLWKREKNIVGSIAVMLLSIIGTIIPAYVLYLNA